MPAAQLLSVACPRLQQGIEFEFRHAAKLRLMPLALQTMDEPASTRQPSVPAPPSATTTTSAWPAGHWLGIFELEEVVACSASGIVYRAWDHGLAMQVALKEFLPSQLAARTADGRVSPLAIENAAAFELGLQAFVDEARKLAHCDHPALVRVMHLLQSHGTGYRVMPWYASHSLIEARRNMAGPPSEAWLRSLLNDLLGALEAYHRVSGAHGGLQPAQIQLLRGDRALLLGPAAARRALAGASAQGKFKPGSVHDEQAAPSADVSQGPWSDLYALADVARYCITGMMPPLPRPVIEEPLAATVQRLFFDVPAVHYSDALLSTLDAALSANVAERPQSVAHFRARLDGPSRESVEAQKPDGAERLRLIQRVVATMPPARAEPPVPATAPPEAATLGRTNEWDGEITADRIAPTTAPRRHALLAGSIVAALGLATAVAWQWREDLLAIRSEAPSNSAPAASAPASSVIAAAPEVSVVPASAPEALPAEASEPEAPAARASEPETAPAVDARIESPPAAPVAAVKPRATDRAESGTPRTQCGSRSDFSLYRCMQQQCNRPQWLQHPQCLRLKATDNVD